LATSCSEEHKDGTVGCLGFRDAVMDKLDRRFLGGLVFLSVGNMWIVGGFMTTKEAAARAMFLLGLFLSIQGAWLIFKSRARRG